MTEPTPDLTSLLRQTETYLTVTHTHAHRHDTLGADYACCGCALRERITATLAATQPDHCHAAMLLRLANAAEETHAVADDTIWLERRPCGCIVAVVVAHVPGEWKLTTSEDAALHFHPTEGERRRAAKAGLSVEPVTAAQYREQYRDRWHCNRHAAAVSAARP